MSSSTFKGYDTPFPVGVKLPEIKIQKKYYDEVSCKDLGDNFKFLRISLFIEGTEKTSSVLIILLKYFFLFLTPRTSKTR